MKQRGRKSSASLSVAPTSNVVKLPPPPSHLSAKAGALWRMVMATRAAEIIQVEAYPVLVEYCRAVEQADNIAERIDKFDIGWLDGDPDDPDDTGESALRFYDKLLAMQERSSRSIASLSVKLRISPSTRIKAQTAGRIEDKGTGPRKPWLHES